jgi:hypothetical protein
LDYNPDNIIQASKRLATISLEQMKNPLFDPDQATLSSMDAERNLEGNMGELGNKILDIQQLFTTGKNLAFREAQIQFKEFDRINRRADLDVLEDRMADLNALYGELSRMRGEGRKKGSKDKSPRKSKSRQNIQLVIEDEDPQDRRERLSQQSIRNYFRDVNVPNQTRPATIVSREPSGRYSVYPLLEYGNRLETTGAVADGDDENPENEDNSYDPFENYNYRGNYPDDSDDSDDGDGGRPPYGSPEPSDLGDNQNNPSPSIIIGNITLSQVLQLITKKCREADILLVSKIKPALQKLSQIQLQQLKQYYDVLTEGWDGFINAKSTRGGVYTEVSVFTIINETLQYGDQIIKVMKEELDKLRMDLLVLVNSYKQNEAIAPPFYLPSNNKWFVNPEVRELVETGERLDDGGVSPELQSFSSTGSGRGGARSKPIAIPTIWEASVRSCPTKYLL